MLEELRLQRDESMRSSSTPQQGSSDRARSFGNGTKSQSTGSRAAGGTVFGAQANDMVRHDAASIPKGSAGTDASTRAEELGATTCVRLSDLEAAGADQSLMLLCQLPPPSHLVNSSGTAATQLGELPGRPLWFGSQAQEAASRSPATLSASSGAPIQRKPATLTSNLNRRLSLQWKSRCLPGNNSRCTLTAFPARFRDRTGEVDPAWLAGAERQRIRRCPAS